MNTPNQNMTVSGDQKLPQILEEVDGTIHIFAPNTNPDDIAFNRAIPMLILPVGTSLEEAIRIRSAIIAAEFTYADEHADSLDHSHRMIYTTVAPDGAEEKHSVGCEDLADALDLARNIYPDATLFGHNPIDIIVGGEVVAQIIEN